MNVGPDLGVLGVMVGLSEQTERGFTEFRPQTFLASGTGRGSQHVSQAGPGPGLPCSGPSFARPSSAVGSAAGGEGAAPACAAGLALGTTPEGLSLSDVTPQNLEKS